MKILIILLALIFALPASAAVVEVRYTISIPKTVSRPKISPKPPDKAVHAEARDVLKTAGQSAEIESRTGASGFQSEDEIIDSMRNPALIRHIYASESGAGRFDECKRRGVGHNGFGMGESVTRLRTIGPNCYATFREVVQLVDNWIEKYKAQGFTESEMGCYYVKGIRATSCGTYWE